MQTINVAAVCRQSQMQALVLSQDTPLETAISRFANDHHLRGIFLVDEEEQLVGVVNKQDLLDWVRLQFALPSQHKPPALGQVRRLLRAETVRDLSLPGSRDAAVSLSDTLATALDKMARYNRVDIPVVDGNGRIVNDLRLSEILAYVLNTGPRNER